MASEVNFGNGGSIYANDAVYSLNCQFFGNYEPVTEAAIFADGTLICEYL